MTIESNIELTPKQENKLISIALENKYKDKNAKIDRLLFDGEKLTIKYIQNKPKFERIRRITGYITGDLTTWNKAKLSEEKDRVKHA